MRIVLIGNYPPDRQESMERFAQMLNCGFNNAGIKTSIWRPTVFFAAKANSTTKGLGKWLGYLDKWVLFPMVLNWKLLRGFGSKDNVHFHICDHSNAPYLKHLPASRTAITCHDVLAIRGALGHSDAFCEASAFGKILQKWILANLNKSTRLAAVSRLTLKQLQDLSPSYDTGLKEWRVIHNAFNDDFRPLSKQEADPLLQRAGVSGSSPYLLHVGSSLPRKNRKMLLDMVHAAGSNWMGKIVFAGQAIDAELKEHAAKLGLSDRVISVLKPDHQSLLALYSQCYAFVFPSFSEGFGWPVIEAQACGAPVIASDVEPMSEVSGGAALHANPHDARAFADALIRLGDKDYREKLIKGGLENGNRFKPMHMVNAYLELLSLKEYTGYATQSI
ncbi:glycosyltransferase family 4 protein [Desertivirga arenae]|uniref:glycosyltransferase family 4 protein n=1 Tax=Desertivirga arenae TaxID=2810309 RepID=UPI001A97A070|nr:glycosyltransferase family 1 protein [Pedobacter sp. SYSU D00823]